MGCHQRKHRRSFKNTVVINEIEKEKQFTYLYPKGKIYCLTDLDFNVLILDVELERWNSNQVPLWPNEKNVRKRSLFYMSSWIASISESFSFF